MCLSVIADQNLPCPIKFGSAENDEAEEKSGKDDDY